MNEGKSKEDNANISGIEVEIEVESEIVAGCSA